jgi:uncharacterized protein YbjQ (UPF0145 family)
MSEPEWWVSTGEGSVHPATLGSLREWLLDGRIGPATQVKTGTFDWIEARLAPQLRDVMAELTSQAKDRELNFFLTTETTLVDYEVTRRIEVITSECAFGMNLFRDFFAGLSDIFGGRSNATQKVLKDARRHCLAELRKEALALTADAVIGIDLDYSEFSGGGKSMLFLVASGTAVRLRKLGAR